MHRGSLYMSCSEAHATFLLEDQAGETAPSYNLGLTMQRH